MSSVTRDELLEMLYLSAFAKIYQFELFSFGDGECTLIVPFQKSLERAGGFVAGSVFVTAADVTMWLAIASRLGTAELTVTTSMNTLFLKSARAEKFNCTARILKVGRSLICGIAECAASKGEILSHSTITYARIARQQVP